MEPTVHQQRLPLGQVLSEGISMGHGGWGERREGGGAEGGTNSPSTTSSTATGPSSVRRYQYVGKGDGGGGGGRGQPDDQAMEPTVHQQCLPLG